MQIFIVDPYDVYKLVGAIIAFLAVFFSCSAGTAAYGQDESGKQDPTVFTKEERAKAVDHLNQTRAKFREALSGLSDEQLNFKAGADRWSIAEVAEHIVVAEQTVFGLISEKIAKGPENASPDAYRVRDSAIPLAIMNRNQKFTAPPPVQPTGRWKSRDELISEFDSARSKTISFVRSTDINLRTHFAENPVMGMIDAFQWIIFLDSHARRHLAQIAEVKSDAGYPGR